jgi:hypothetical protein
VPGFAGRAGVVLRIAGRSPTAAASTGVVGTFWDGMLNPVGRPVTLPTWRVSTAYPAVAVSLVDRYGGRISARHTRGEENIAVDLAVDVVHVVLEGGGRGLRVRFVARDPGQVIVYTSDGDTITYPNATTTPDPHAGYALADRISMARQGHGPRIEVDALFRLAADPDLGVFCYRAINSASLVWSLAEQDTETVYAAIGGPAAAILAKTARITSGGTPTVTTTITVLGPAYPE